MPLEYNELQNLLEQAITEKDYEKAKNLLFQILKNPEKEHGYYLLLKMTKDICKLKKGIRKTFKKRVYSASLEEDYLTYFVDTIKLGDYPTAIYLMDTNQSLQRKFNQDKILHLYELLLSEIKDELKKNQKSVLNKDILSYGNIDKDFRIEKLQYLKYQIAVQKKEETISPNLIMIENVITTILALQNQSGEFENLFSSLSYPDNKDATITFQTAMQYGDYPTALTLLNTKYDQIFIKKGVKSMLKKLLEQLSHTTRKQEITKGYKEDLKTLESLIKADLLDDAFVYYLEHDFSYLKEDFHSIMQGFMQLVSHQKEEEKSQNKDEKFISERINQLSDKGIILLAPMSRKRQNRIEEIVKNMKDVESFTIKPEKEEQIVLRFKPYVNERMDIGELHQKGKEAYAKGDYDTCISLYRKSLEFGNPPAFVYARLGLAYLKKALKEQAIPYLTVATELSKKENGPYDFTELLLELKGQIPRKDLKHWIHIEPTFFKNDLDNYYGINEVFPIAQLVSSGISLEEACLRVGLPAEKISIVYLIFARNYYAQEQYGMGDRLLKKVEKDKNKSQFAKSLYEEIRINKNFYKNRGNEETPNSLVRILKEGKNENI